MDCSMPGFLVHHQLPGACSNSCPLSRWRHPTISSSVVPFSCLQSFPASGSFLMSQFFASVDRSIGVSASLSVLPVNTQDWFPLGWAGLISLQILYFTPSVEERCMLDVFCMLVRCSRPGCSKNPYETSSLKHSCQAVWCNRMAVWKFGSSLKCRFHEIWPILVED